MAIELGDMVRDRVTLFEGIAIAHTRWLSDCDRHFVQSRNTLHEGKPVDGVWFDTGQLEVVEAGTALEKPRAVALGGATGGGMNEETGHHKVSAR